MTTSSAKAAEPIKMLFAMSTRGAQGSIHALVGGMNPPTGRGLMAIILGMLYSHSSNCTTLHPFNGLFSRTTWVSRYQKGKEMMGIRDAVASAGPYANNLHLSPDRNHTPTPHRSVSTGRMILPSPNQQRRSITNSK